MPNPFVGAPNGAMWGFDPTSGLWLPVQVGPVQTGPTGEEYAPLIVQTLGTAAITAASGAIVDLPPKGSAGQDGQTPTNLLAEAMYLYSSGGQVDATGKPTQLSFDRMASLQGKKTAFGTITSTLAGDTALVFSVAPKTIMPGQRIRLTGAGATEYAVVSSAYAPSSVATSIPLQVPLGQAGNTAASWDIYNDTGPGTSSLLPTNIGLSAAVMVEPGTSSYYIIGNARQDSTSVSNLLEVVQGAYNGSSIDRLRVPTIFKAFNAQAVTASSANTPTAIWTPTAGKKFRLMGYSFSSTVAAGIVFHDLAAVGGTGLMPIPSPVLAANGNYTTPPLGNGILSAVADNKLWIDTTVASNLTGYVWGTEE